MQGEKEEKREKEKILTKELIMKAGIKTTEFWLSIAAFVLGIVITFIPEGHWAYTIVGGIISALAAAGYSWSRGKAKSSS